MYGRMGVCGWYVGDQAVQVGKLQETAAARGPCEWQSERARLEDQPAPTATDWPCGNRPKNADWAGPGDLGVTSGSNTSLRHLG